MLPCAFVFGAGGQLGGRVQGDTRVPDSQYLEPQLSVMASAFRSSWHEPFTAPQATLEPNIPFLQTCRYINVSIECKLIGKPNKSKYATCHMPSLLCRI